jgi:Family of unknown function (DUF6272)
MDPRDVYSLTQMLAQQHVSLCYSGYLSEEVLAGLSSMLRSTVAADNQDENLGKRVFSVFIEQAQNVMRYSADQLQDPDGCDHRFGIITFGIQDKFFVLTGNRMLTADAERLRATLEEIRDLNKEDLRSYYRERLNSPPREGDKGAGLGLIEIARRVSQPFEFDFIPLDDCTSFFCLKAYI